MEIRDVLGFVESYGSILTGDEYSATGDKACGLILFMGLPIIFTALACRLSYSKMRRKEEREYEYDYYE